MPTLAALFQRVVIQGQGIAAFQAQINSLAVSTNAAFASIQNAGSSIASGIVRANTAVQNFQGTINNANARVASFGSTLRSTAAILGVAFGARELVTASDAFTNLNNSIRVATDGAQEHADVLDKIREISLETGTSIEANAKFFQRFNLVFEDLDVSTGQAVTMIDTLNKSLIISGRTAAEATGGVRQLTQAFGRGQLRGDEFISVMENLPQVAIAIAKAMNVPVSSLNQLARDGAITADILRKAIDSMTADVAQQWAEVDLTIARSMENLNTQFILWIGNTNEATGAAQTLAQAINTLAANLDTVATVLGVVIGLWAGGRIFVVVLGVIANIITFIGTLTPLGIAVRVVIAALTLAITYLTTKQSDAAVATQKHNEIMLRFNELARDARLGVDGAAEALQKYSTEQINAAKAAIARGEAEILAANATVESITVLNEFGQQQESIAGNAAANVTSIRDAYDELAVHKKTLAELEQGMEDYAKSTAGGVEGTAATGKAVGDLITVTRGVTKAVYDLNQGFGETGRLVNEAGEKVDSTGKKVKLTKDELAEAQRQAKLVGDEFNRIVTITKGLQAEKVLIPRTEVERVEYLIEQLRKTVEEGGDVEGVLGKIKTALEAVNEAEVDPETIAAFNEQIAELVEKSASVADTVGPAFEAVGRNAGELTATVDAEAAKIPSFYERTRDQVESTFSTMVSNLTDFLQEIASAASRVADQVVDHMNRVKSSAEAAKRAVDAVPSGGGGGSGFASGGFVWGAGTATSDSIWGKLSRGEFVIRAAAVMRYGRRFFDILNKMLLPADFIKGFNLGGFVDAITPVPAYANGGQVSMAQIRQPLVIPLAGGQTILAETSDMNVLEKVARHKIAKQLNSLGNVRRNGR